MKKPPSFLQQEEVTRPESRVLLQGKEVVLVAVTGLSPAVMTETVWALAETENLVPHRVVAVTTAEGARRITGDLETPDPAWGGSTVWEALRAAVARRVPGTAERLILQKKVMEQPDVASGRMEPMADIRNARDNLEAADAILSVVEEVTKEPNRILLASVAGGRKSMGALLYGAVSLRGRPGDRVLHVLVNDPFEDGRLRPRFYFPPDPPVEHRITNPAGAVIQQALSSQARIQLAEVAFVPLRHLVPEGELAGGFRGMVERLTSAALTLSTGPATVRIDPEKRSLTVQGVEHRPARIGAFELLVYILENQGSPALRRSATASAFENAVDHWKATLTAAARTAGVSAKTLTDALSEWRLALPEAIRPCLPKGKLFFPALTLGEPGDIRGYPDAGAAAKTPHTAATKRKPVPARTP